MLRPPLFPPKPIRTWAGTPLHARMIDDPAWIVEPKIDGDRCLTFITPDGVQLWSRHGRRFTNAWLADLTAQVASLALPVGTVLDGELVAGTKSQRLHLYDLASMKDSYGARRRALVALARQKALPSVEVVPWMEKATAYQDALAAKHEGIVWKRVDSPYAWQSSTSNNEVPTWIKMKP